MSPYLRPIWNFSGNNLNWNRNVLQRSSLLKYFGKGDLLFLLTCGKLYVYVQTGHINHHFDIANRSSGHAFI